jgi:hypothetical protein
MERRPDRSDSDRLKSVESVEQSAGPAGSSLPAATIGDAPVSLALWLRAGRIRRGMSLDDVARVTKIQPRILERLEAGKLEGLPAEVFVRGFVRSVARCVGLDEREALRRHAACGGVAALGSTEIIPPAPAFGPSARALAEVMADLAPSSATTARATPRKMIAVEIAEPADAEGIAQVPIPGAGPACPPCPPCPGDLAVAIGLAAGSIVRAPGAIGDPRAPSADALLAEPGEAPAKIAERAQAADPLLGAPEPASAVEPDAAISPAPEPVDASPAIDASPADEAPSLPLAAATVAVGTPPVPSAASERKKKKGRRAKGRNKRRVLATGTPAGTSAVGDATWAPRMPPPGTSPSVPWRKPAYASSPSVIVPHLVIDDADPDSAELVLEERAEKQAPRRSFLPPILLDREDRSSRQGGLTLAVIILLIAATLTLSYLMRRPSASGDGMTLRGHDRAWPATKQV